MNRQHLGYLTEELMLEDAITITLLEVPEFRQKAGLPPRAPGCGDNRQTIGTLLGMSRERVRQIEAKALRKIRRAVLDNPDLRREFAPFLRSVGL